MEQLVGQTLDRYKILSLLGEGGMGAVFKARDLTLQRDVAIKVMHSQFARQPDFQERFLQEARTAARLDHPSVVQVYDFGSSRSFLYIVMEFIPGANLRELLKRLKENGKWILLNEAVQIIQQVALALDYAHRQGVLHRDLKPANIMLEPEPSGDLPYRPVLTDLGLAKLLEGGLVTREGTSMGTPAYMSPEQALGQTTDARSDVYSLGILLYELSVGRLPFAVRTITEAIRYHTKESPPPPRSLRPDLPTKLETVILKALEKNPADRFSSAAEFSKSLETIAPDVTEIAESTVALGGAVSLMTQYQASLVEARGPSILREFPETPAGLSKDRIQIMMKDRTTRSVDFKPGGMTIGRDENNDIVIDDQRASRQHARIEFDGVSYKIIDLDSTNGTFLSNARLLPGVPEIWTPDAALQIGSCWLRLIRPRGQTEPSTAAVRFDPSKVLSSAGEGRVGVFLESYKLTADPGIATTTTIILLNQGPVVDHFKIAVEGIPAQWIPSRPPLTQLMPGQQQEIKLTIQPPRDPHSRAGRYPITIRVSSQDDPSQTAEVKATLTVTAFSEFSSNLHPQRVRSGKNARITIDNQGNTQAAFELDFKDRAAELNFKPPRVQLQVPEGQSAVAEFQASPRNRRIIGGEQTHPFTAQVVSSDKKSQTYSGEVISRALIPTWVLPVVIFLCIILASAAGLYYRGVVNARATEQAFINGQTATALALIDLSVQQTLDANQAARGTATALAETAMAEGDDDGDGLSNLKETTLGTDPNNPDTDGDGLSDGLEVNQYGTQPTNQDSDGDTLKDGQEVNELNTSPINPDTDGDSLNDGVEVAAGSNPLKTDTDGDGISDDQDSDPVNTSTPTPDLDATQQYIADLTATAVAAAALEEEATNLTATAQMAATLTAQAIQPIAYIYSTDSGTANSYKSLLESNGYKVELIPQSSVLSKDFSSYRAIFIGPETGDNYTWGDGGGNQANHLDSANVRILGLGEGGASFFHKLNLQLGYGHCAGGSATSVYVVDPSSSYWTTPNNISIPGDRMVKIYNSNSYYQENYYPDPISGVVGIGRNSSSGQHYRIIRQDTKYMLWGFNDGPSNMTSTGKKVFINVLKEHLKLYLLLRPIIITTINP
jgi:serine/threonine protein kinase